jgi:hypothetical protein
VPRGVRIRLSLAFLLAFGAGVHAQDSPAPETATPQASGPRQPKPPPPPLFPKHRRGIYRNNQDLEFVDATPQSPPLDIDDPGVPDKGEFEINLTTGVELETHENHFNVLHADVNYGIEPTLFGHHVPTQLKFECPLSVLNERGSPAVYGVGQAAVGVKLNFYNDERRGMSLALYPQWEFAPARSIDRELAEPGRAFILPLLFQKDFKAITMVANAGIEKPFAGFTQKSIVKAALGAGRALTRKLGVMGDVSFETPSDMQTDRLSLINVGIIYGVRHVPVYASVGHSIMSDDGPHTFFLVGIKLTSD